jgi:hypothetical protein
MIFVCGPDDIAPGECTECGGWLHRVQPGGFDNPGSTRVCSEECIDSAQTHQTRHSRSEHVRLRDLMCRCEVCVEAGHPTEAELAEYEEFTRTGAS